MKVIMVDNLFIRNNTFFLHYFCHKLYFKI